VNGLERTKKGAFFHLSHLLNSHLCWLDQHLIKELGLVSHKNFKKRQPTATSIKNRSLNNKKSGELI
jgi:hypothetical protein